MSHKWPFLDHFGNCFGYYIKTSSQTIAFVSHCSCIWHNNLALLFSLFLVWGELMLMIGRLPTFGIYVQMFTTVAKNFAKFLAAYFCLLVAFALCFCVLYPNYQSFNVPFPAAVVKTLGCFLSKFSNV